MAALKSMGTKLYWDTTPDPVQIVDLTSIGEVGIESDEIDVTTLDSPDGFKEFIAGLKDGGEIGLAGIVKSEANLSDLLDLADGQDVEDWYIEWLDGSKLELVGYIKTCKIGESTMENAKNFVASIRLSGKPVYTEADLSV